MLNGSYLRNVASWPSPMRGDMWGVGDPGREDFCTLQYIIPVIRDLKVMVTPDVIAAYVASMTASGYYLGSVFGDYGNNDKFCEERPSKTREPEGLIINDFERIPDELKVMAERYARNILESTFKYVAGIYYTILDRFCYWERGPIHSSWIPNRLFQGIKLLSQLPRYWTSGAFSTDARSWTNINSVIRDARATGLPTAIGKEYFNSAFGSWEPSGVKDRSEENCDSLGRCGSYYLPRAKVNNSVRVDSETVDYLKNMLSIVMPRYEEDKKHDFTINFDYEVLADALELVQYFIGVASKEFGPEIYSRLIDKEATAIEDSYRPRGYQASVGYDESLEYMSPLAALIMVRNIARFMKVEVDNCGNKRIAINIGKSLGGVPHSSKYPSVKAFLMTEINRQASSAEGIFDKITAERREDIRKGDCAR